MTTTPQFDKYFLGDELLEDACRGVTEAVAQTRAAGLEVEGYASHSLNTEAGEPSTEAPSTGIDQPMEGVVDVSNGAILRCDSH